MRGVRGQPDVGEQLIDVCATWQFCQDGTQPCPWFHFAGLAAGDEAHQDRGAMAGLRAADEQPVFPADCDRLHSAFGRVVVDTQVAILKVAVQSVPLIERIGCRLANHLLREKILFVEPRPEITKQRRSVLLSLSQAKLGVAIPAGTFDFIQPTDESKNVVSAF